MWPILRLFGVALSYGFAVTVSSTGIDQTFKNSCEQFQESISVNLQQQTELLKHILEIKQTGKTPHNVAVGRLVSQSSEYPTFLYPATNAIDGSMNKFAHTNWQKRPYWWIDLDNMYKIVRVEIFSREDCCGEYIHDMDITVGPSLNEMRLCVHYTGPARTGEHLVLNCRNTLTGRFVKLSIYSDNAAMQLAEVKVFAYD